MRRTISPATRPCAADVVILVRPAPGVNAAAPSSPIVTPRRAEREQLALVISKPVTVIGAPEPRTSAAASGSLVNSCSGGRVSPPCPTATTAAAADRARLPAPYALALGVTRRGRSGGGTTVITLDRGLPEVYIYIHSQLSIRAEKGRM
jgi:hypothetical protein